MFGRRKRQIPQLNTTSTADISFMLLIFFLVTTSMDADKGLSRKLPPPEKPRQEQTNISKNNLMSLVITADNQLLMGDKPVSQERIRQEAEHFIQARGRNHLISIKVDTAARYDIYFTLQNELVRAYTACRNRISMKKYGMRYALLSPEQKDVVNDIYPQRIAETYQEEGKGGNP